MRDILIILLLVVAGCTSPSQQLVDFEDKHNLEPVPVEYLWLPTSIFPHAKNGKITVNRTALADYKECEAEILIHERCHVAGLKHCKDENCLMHYKLHEIPVHFLDKILCQECEAELANK